MAFKLKSPFHANVVTIKETLRQGGQNSMGQKKEAITNPGIKVKDAYEAEGEETIEEETPGNKETKRLLEKVEKGVPVSLNPKQKARLETQKYKKGIRDDAKFKRQTEKAKKIYERNQFEELQNLDKKGKIIKEGKEGAGTTYYNPDAAKKEKEKREKASQDRLEKATLEAGAATTAANISSRKIDKKIKKLSLNMEGKLNRAGTPVRMLRSVEDPTPMKYKSVRKAGREGLMSALAKKGEVDEPKGKIKQAVDNFKTRNELVSYKKENSNAVVVTTKKKAKKAEKKQSKKADIKKKQSKNKSGKGGKVVMDRKVSVKF